MDFFVPFGQLDERADRGRCGVKNADLVFFDHLPEAAGVRVGGNAFENDLGRTGSQRAVSDIGVPGDPADVGRAPEHILRLDVEDPVHRQLGPQQITTGAVLHTLGLAGRTRGIQNEQRVLGTDKLRLTDGLLAGRDFMHQAVAAGQHVAGGGCALINHHVFDGLAATHGNAFVNNRLERQLFAATQLVVGRDHRDGARVLNPLLQALGGKAAKHDRVGRANTRAGLHRDHALDRHWHVNDDPVTPFDAHGFERIGKLADLGVQLLVSDVGHFAVIALENNGFLVFGGGAKVAVQAVVGGIELAVRKPLVKRRIGLIQRLGKRLFPDQVFARQPGPETLKVFFSFSAQGVVRVHAGDAGGFGERRARMKHPIFDQCGFDSG